MTKGLMSFYSTLQYSLRSVGSTSRRPSVHDRDFQERLQPLNYLFIRYNFVILYGAQQAPSL